MKQIVWIKVKFSQMMRDERGASAIEYGLIAALIGVGLVAGLSAFGSSTNGAWGTMANAVDDGLG